MANNFTTGLYDPTSNYQPGRSPTSVSGVSGGGSSLYAQPSKVPNTSTQMQPPMNPYAVPGAKGGKSVGPYSVPGAKGGPSTAQVPTSGMTRGSSSLAGGYNPIYQSSMNSAPVGPDYGVTRDLSGFFPPLLGGGDQGEGGDNFGVVDQDSLDVLNDVLDPGDFQPRPGEYYPEGTGPNPSYSQVPDGWPANLPHPPSNITPGTPAWNKWLNDVVQIDPRHPMNYLMQELLFRENMGVQTPSELAPWADNSGGYTSYMQKYLAGLGLGMDDVPDSFRQDLYSQISGDYAGLADRAAGMVGGVNPYEAMNQIEDFDPTQAAGYDTLAKYMDNVYSDEYGGYMGFDPKVLQTAGIQQAEIGRAAAERAMGDQLASAGLTGQPNALYTSAPMYGEYLQNRIRAIQDPVVQAAELGIQGVGTTMGALGDLYGLGQSADVARANALLEGQGLNLQADLGRAGLYSSLAGQGLGVAADVGLGAAQGDYERFRDMQNLYGQMPLTEFELSLLDNEYVQGMYDRAQDQSNTTKDRRAGRKAADRAQVADIGGGVLGAAGGIVGAALGGSS